MIPCAKGKAHERALAAVFAEHAPDKPTDKPVLLQVKLTFPVARSWPNWKREAALAGTRRHVGKPDLSRLVIVVEDALTGIAWLDDRQVVKIEASKKYGERPGTSVLVVELAQRESR